MGDKLLEPTQIINGLALMLSFFVGYRYAIKRSEASSTRSSSESGGKSTTESSNAMSERVFSNCDENYKMVLVVRNDLKMGKGKIAAQCGHGAVGAYQRAMVRSPRLVRIWEGSGSAKIALKVESEAEMMAIKRSAEQHHLNTCLIRDAGRTQIEPNTKTVLAIGPAAVVDIDQITGHLKLL